ncbi:MAG: hypothetical protein AB7S42_10855, partial [Lysobacteraceae bacterium]
DYRHRGAQQSTRYAIRVENPRGVCRGVRVLELDGRALPPEESFALADDGGDHRVRVLLG